MSCSASSSRRRVCLGVRGTTALEFALIFPLLMTLFLGISDISRYYVTLEAVRSAAAEAARAAIVNTGLNACGSTAIDAARPSGILNRDLLTLCVSRTVNGGETVVNINASYPFSFLTPMFGATTRTISESTSLRF